jgi:hypothetical protein
MQRRKHRPGAGRGLIAKIRKPTAPPTRVEENVKKYRRPRERERLRRETREP